MCRVLPKTPTGNTRFQIVEPGDKIAQMESLDILRNVFIVLRDVLGTVAILFGAYLTLEALPELGRYLRIRRM